MTQKKPSPAQNAKKATKPGDKPSQTFLYLLRDPNTGAVRYAGKANAPAARLLSHIRDARRRSAPLHCWIRSLGAQGKRPVMSVLCAVSVDQWEDAERVLIAALRESDAELLNVAPGGNCPVQRPGAYLAENGRRTARAIHHGDPRARRAWELRKAAGTEIRWLEGAGCTAAAQKLRSALARLDAAEASCR